MSKEKKRNIIIGSLCAVVLLMAVGYAAFQTVLNINGTSNITSSWNVKITGITSKNIKGTASNNGTPIFEDLTATFKTNLEAPGDSIEYDITVKNAGTLNAKLDKITLSDTNNPAIKFTSSGLSQGDVLNAGNTTTLTIKVEFLSSVTEQPTSISSTLTVDLDYIQATSTTPSGESAADKLIETAVTSGDGLYEDTYEEGRYVYKGANPSNYITFNGEEWRIMAVEADGTLKIIKGNPINEYIFFDDDKHRIAPYCNGTSLTKGCNIWGSSSTMLDSNENHVTKLPSQIGGEALELPSTESTLNIYLNNDYYNSLTNEAKDQIAAHTFNVGLINEYTSNQDLSVDISLEKTSKWKGKIGLINPSDYVRASTNSSCTSVYQSNRSPLPCKIGNYLYEPDYAYPTITPTSSRTDHCVLYVYNNNFGLSYGGVTGGGRNKPALYLKPDITLSGEGTSSNPYIIALK